MNDEKLTLHKITPFDPTKCTSLSLKPKKRKVVEKRERYETRETGKPWIDEDAMWFREESVGD